MKIVQYRIVMSEFFNVLQLMVNEAIGLGWQPFGNLVHAEFQLNPENMSAPRIRKAFLQTMALYEGATPITVPPPPAALSGYSQVTGAATPGPMQSGVFPPMSTPTPPVAGGS